MGLAGLRIWRPCRRRRAGRRPRSPHPRSGRTAPIWRRSRRWRSRQQPRGPMMGRTNARTGSRVRSRSDGRSTGVTVPTGPKRRTASRSASSRSRPCPRSRAADRSDAPRFRRGAKQAAGTAPGDESLRTEGQADQAKGGIGGAAIGIKTLPGDLPGSVLFLAPSAAGGLETRLAAHCAWSAGPRFFPGGLTLLRGRSDWSGQPWGRAAGWSPCCCRCWPCRLPWGGAPRHARRPIAARS